MPRNDMSSPNRQLAWWLGIRPLDLAEKSSVEGHGAQELHLSVMHDSVMQRRSIFLVCCIGKKQVCHLWLMQLLPFCSDILQ